MFEFSPETLAACDDVQYQTAAISEQNQQAASHTADTDLEALTYSQQVSFDALVRSGEIIPYQELGELIVRTSQERTITENTLNELTAAADDTERQRTLAIQLCGNSAETHKNIDYFADRKLEDIAQLSTEAEGTHAITIKLEAEAEQVMARVPCAAWPIPTLLRGQEKSDQQMVIDKISRAYNGKIHEASKLIGLVLAEVPGTPFTYSQIGAALYPDDIDNPAVSLHGRIGAHISNYERGKVTGIGDMLAELGLRFDRCTVAEELSGGKIVQRAAFRAVPIDN